MYAYEIPNLRFSGEAATDLENHVFATVNADGLVITATADTQVIGVTKAPAKTGQIAELADGIVQVKAAADIEAGASVKPDANGYAVVADLAGVGTAMTPVKAGGLVSVKIY